MVFSNYLTTLFFLVLCFIMGGSTQAQGLSAVQEGDIIFQSSRSAQSLAIQQATDSRYSHMGIILLRQGKPYVFEAAATVKYTPLSTWIAQGEGKHYVVKRLKNAGQILTPSALQRIHQQAAHFAGKPYDALFSWSDEKLYCSELVWKMYDRALGMKVGHLQKIKEFRLDTPAVKQKLRERYGENIPMNETVISPKAMFESPLLVTLVTQ